MDYKSAINIVKNIITNFNDENYDGIIVKRLEASNTLDEGRTSNQTHIAISGPQMDIFPYITADGYFNCDYADKDEELKKYFVLQIPFRIYSDNLEYLKKDDGNIRLIDYEQYHKVDVSVLRSRRKKGADQVQLSLIALDSKQFVEFRKLLHTGDYLIILKRLKSTEYDCIGVKATDAAELAELHNTFYKLETNTVVKLKECVNQYDLGKQQAENLLLYGVPGSGKSYEVSKICSDENYMERVVFHPDYTYSDFVGQILPKLNKEKKLEYDFVEGPFTRILKRANEDPDHMYYLVIEEINRGNAPAIFGEIFQLLDRNKTGESEYGITNYEIADKVYSDANKLVKIPSNLSLIATMNTSDQNVFTLDTAFQRRWTMRHIANRFDNDHANELIKGTAIRWGAFATVINELIMEENVDITGAGDKRLGAYFVKSNELVPEVFSEKVLKYLWDDAFRMEKDLIFDDDYKSLEEVIEKYEYTTNDKLQAVLRVNVYKQMLEKSKIEENDSSEE